MKFSLGRHLREVWRGGVRADAPSRRATTWAGGSSLEGLEDRKLLSIGVGAATRAAVAENNINVANFHLRLPFAPKFPLMAHYQTFDESAKSTPTTKKDPISGITFTHPPQPPGANVGEYVAKSGAFAYVPTAKDQVIPVAVTPDKDFEFHEVFGLQVDTPGRTRYGIARVINQHGRIPHPRVSNPTIVETGNGPLQANFVVSLSFAPKSQQVYIYRTLDESAKAGKDYTAQASPGYPPAAATPGMPAPAPPTPPPGATLPTAPTPANPDYIIFNPGQTTPVTIGVPVATEPGYHYPKRFALEVEGPGRLAYGIATIKWIHPRNPIPRVSNPFVIETGGT